MKVLYQGSGQEGELKYGGRKATETEAGAVRDFLSHYTMEEDSLGYDEVDLILRDSYGRCMFYVDLTEDAARHTPLFIVFQTLDEEGNYTASPKAVLRVRDGAILSGIEREKVRNNWDCPLEMSPLPESWQ